ncbi:cysteine methyltransferase [Nostoc sp. 3335mG]|nr:cysteine methyltransferase [Nostoc sp. 3335mG]
MSQTFTVFETVNGFAGIAWSAKGVTNFALPAQSREAAVRYMHRRAPQAVEGEPTASIAKVIADARRYFLGERIDFSDVPLDLHTGDSFFAQVYARVRALDYGETTTYGAVARELGAEPQAARDVGQAMATNPIPLIVPCHRVLAAGGKIGGFSAPGGSHSKAKMLELEQALPKAAEAAQATFGF